MFAHQTSNDIIAGYGRILNVCTSNKQWYYCGVWQNSKCMLFMSYHDRSKSVLGGLLTFAEVLANGQTTTNFFAISVCGTYSINVV